MAQVVDEPRRLAAGRVPPHNLEAEQSVLGSMMLSPDAIAEVTGLLQPDDFYRSGNGQLYQALLSIYARGEPVDAVTAVEELRRIGTLQSVGGPLYVNELVEEVPTPASAPHYARIVAELAQMRRLIRAAGEVMEMAYSVPENPAQAADEAEAKIYAVARHHEKEEVVPLQVLVEQAMKDLENIQQRESAYAGVPTGFRDLDVLLSGLQRGNLIVVAARPGVGKSSLVTNMARNVAVEAGVPVAMFSLEMSRWEIGMRLLCAEAKVPWDRVRGGRINAEDWSRIVEGAEVLNDAPLSIVDSGNVTIVDIRAKARRLRHSNNLGMLIVDYLQLMSHYQRVDNRQQEIAEISRSLKMLAKELDIPVIAVSQLNRQVENRADKKPQLADLRECVTGDTLVTLADGSRRPIADLVGTQPEVVSVSPEGRLVQARASRVWRVGERKTFRVRLRSGRTITGTGLHRLLGASGWTRVENLRVGDRLALARRTPEPEEPEVWPDARVALLGHLIGDGSYLSGQPMRYTTVSEANSRVVATASREEFGCTVRRYEGSRAWHQLVISGNGNRWRPAGLNAWLRELGIFGQRSEAKRVPDAAFRLGNRQVALLLRHLWATDGTIHLRSEASRGSSTIAFTSASRGLVGDVAALLLRLGMVGRLRIVRRADAVWHTVGVSGADQRTFLEVVGGFGPRRGPARRLRRWLGSHAQSTNVDTLPREVFDRVRAAMAERGVSHRAMAAARGTSYGGSAHFRFAPSRELIAGHATLLHEPELASVASTDRFWDEVAAIEPAGVAPVYDLTVPGTASWLADAIVSHNSGAIEQDADIVMFIHRSDSEEPSVKGTADLIVAKHRNGPTDTVRLTFLPHLTQFRNYAAGS